MLTKEELLEKGVDEATADEIVAGYPDSDSNPLLDLEKALDPEKDNSEMDDLSKANGEDKDKEEDDKDYDEKFMKKMKSYMKGNAKTCRKMMKEMDGYGDDMKKAIEDIDSDLEGAVIQMEDLSPVLAKISDAYEQMSKAMPELAGRIDAVEDQSKKNFDLMQKASRLQVETAKEMGVFLNTSTGRKGVQTDVKMNKANDTNVAAFSKEDNVLIHQKLMKATKEKDIQAGQLISVFESVGKNANRLQPFQKQIIANEYLSKEAN